MEDESTKEEKRTLDPARYVLNWITVCISARGYATANDVTKGYELFHHTTGKGQQHD